MTMHPVSDAGLRGIFLLSETGLQVCPARSDPMSTPTITIEGHPLASRAGLWCPAGGGHFGRVEVDVAVVLLQESGVERLAVVTGSQCIECGAEELTR